MSIAQQFTPQAVTHKNIWALSWPLFIANISAPLIALSDTFVLGHLSDSVYLAAVAIASQVFSFSILVFAFLTTSTTSLISSCVGQGQADRAFAWVIRSTVFATVAGLGITALMPFIIDRWLIFVGADQNTLPIARNYGAFMIFALFPAILTQSLQGILLGYQKSRQVMYISFTMNICNVGLNILFAVVWDFRAAGVACATLMSYLVAFSMACWMIALELRGKFYFDFRKDFFSISEFCYMIQMNKNLLIRSICIMSYLQLIIKMSAELGQTLIAANSILVMYFLTSSRIQDALATTVHMMISRIWQRDQQDLIQTAYRRFSQWVFGMILVLTFTFLLLGEKFTVFLTSLPEVQLEVINKIWVVALYITIVSWTYFYNCLLLGASEMKRLRNVYLLSISVFLTIAATFYYPQPSQVRLWICVFVFEFCRLALLKWNYHRVFRALGTDGNCLSNRSLQAT